MDARGVHTMISSVTTHPIGGEARSIPRRPIRARGTPWAAALAGTLTEAGVSPNVISAASVAFSGIAGACLVLASSGGSGRAIALYLGAAVFVQLRLLCNLLDGMVAIEGGRASRVGEVWNDLPDRLSDPITLACAGYSIAWASVGSALGWAAAVLAVMVAYVRMLGASVGLAQSFTGPMAKQHRMAVVIVACVVSAVESAAGLVPRAMIFALSIVVSGSAVTVVRRTVQIVRNLG